MHFTADALHAEGDLAWILLRIGDEFIDGSHAETGAHDQQHRLEHPDHQRPEIIHWVEVELGRDKLRRHDRRRCRE